MRLFGHPVHRMLVVFPLGLFSVAVIFDILYLMLRTAALPVVSFYMMAAGIVGGLMAAFFGFMDWLGLPHDSRARRIGVWHGIGNFVIVVLFPVSHLRSEEGTRGRGRQPPERRPTLEFGNALPGTTLYAKVRDSRHLRLFQRSPTFACHDRDDHCGITSREEATQRAAACPFLLSSQAPGAHTMPLIPEHASPCIQAGDEVGGSY